MTGEPQCPKTIVPKRAKYKNTRVMEVTVLNGRVPEKTTSHKGKKDKRAADRQT